MEKMYHELKTDLATRMQQQVDLGYSPEDRKTGWQTADSRNHKSEWS
jgi:hypothetical protein